VFLVRSSFVQTTYNHCSNIVLVSQARIILHTLCWFLKQELSFTHCVGFSSKFEIHIIIVQTTKPFIKISYVL
jgi:hypothetical protein